MANTGGPSDGYATQYDGTNLLTSPWVDLSGMAGTDLYISFQQSIACEPGWDGSWVEYTTDGINWHHLGSANDPNGINWQNSSVYANSPSFTGDPPDTVTMAKPTYALWGPAGSEHVFPMGWWSSNGPPGLPSQPAEGDGHPQGPFGYIFTQLHITPETYPDIVHSANVRFRIVAF